MVFVSPALIATVAVIEVEVTVVTVAVTLASAVPAEFTNDPMVAPVSKPVPVKVIF